jgi:hypothetical protein
VIHVVRSGEVLSHYDVEVMREIVKRVALRRLNEQAESVKMEKLIKLWSIWAVPLRTRTPLFN